jgi:arylsulfatase A
VTQLDSAFGQLMSALDAQSLTDSTFVFFTSDNGPEGDGVATPGRGYSGGLRGRKRDLHEGGIRVPGIARWPGRITAGSTSDVPVIGSDIFPTMLTVAGGEIPGDRVLDGVNVLDVLQGKATSAERTQPLYWRLHMAPNAKVAMRVDNWKILANAELTSFELYDLKSDPRETNDLAASSPDKLKQLSEQLIAHNAAIDAEGPDWWKRLSPDGARPPGQGPAAKKKKANAGKKKL